MLGIQNSLSVNNSVKFGHNEMSDYSYNTPDIPSDEYSFSKEEIELERDKKLKDLDDTKASFEDLADNLDKNPDKISKGTGKVVRLAASAIGIVSTFVMAKYGSKVTINAFRNFAKSKTAQNIMNGTGSFVKPLKSGAKSISKKMADVTSPIMIKVKDSKLGTLAKGCAEKPFVKNTIEKVQGYKEAVKTLAKNINGDKIQSGIENTMAASTTASVIIDDLAGRNNEKSNLNLALGASGGDK